MAINKSSLVLVDYTAKIKDVDKVIETTMEADAKKAGLHDPTQKYKPMLIAVGDGWVLKGLDEALESSKVGTKLNVEITPDKGFGVRDPKKIRLIPLKKFGDQAKDIHIGASVDIDNRRGTVRFVGSGRAQVDFNHQYASKTLIYSVNIIKEITNVEDRLFSLIERRIPLEKSDLKLTLLSNSANIELAEKHYMMEGIQVIKKAISTDVLKYVPKLNKVLFTEIYQNPVDVKTSSKSKPESKTKAKPKSKPESKTKAKPTSKTK